MDEFKVQRKEGESLPSFESRAQKEFLAYFDSKVNFSVRHWTGMYPEQRMTRERFIRLYGFADHVRLLRAEGCGESLVGDSLLVERLSRE